MQTQKQTILKHLKRGWKISTIVSAKKYGITCLTERIRDIRADGYNVLDEWVMQNGKRFKEYRMG